ncbi:hypothetical protein HYSC106933_06585 [Hydrogenibacillus schlegelii]
MAERLLEVEDLVVSFRTYAGKVHAVRGVSFASMPARRWRSSANRGAEKASPFRR